MNIRVQGENNFFSSSLLGYASKSSQQKAERQLKCQNQVDYWEEKKENLKTMKCDNLEDIEKKLEMLQSYEDEIAAVKVAYNHEQIWHALDEAKEKGEKIAEEVKKLEPKTAEERQEEMAEEAKGTEEDKGALTETMEEVAEQIDEWNEAAREQITEKLEEEMAEDMTDELTEQAEDSVEIRTEEDLVTDIQEKTVGQRPRKRLDIRI